MLWLLIAGFAIYMWGYLHGWKVGRGIKETLEPPVKG